MKVNTRMDRSFDIIENIIQNSNKVMIYATGDREYFYENLCIFKHSFDVVFVSYNKLISNIITPSENTYIFAFRLEDSHKEHLKDMGFNVLNFYDMVDYKSKLFWDNKQTYVGVDLNHFQSNPTSRKMMSKASNIPKIETTIEKYFTDCKNLKILSLGCGTGFLERQLVSANIGSHIDAFDISDKSIEEAKKLAKDLDSKTQINYFTGNLNCDTFKENFYDLIIADSCMHHVEALEFSYNSISNALKKDGVFIQREFVGESHFQWSKKKLRKVNSILRLLPKKYKNRDEYTKGSYEFMMQLDPSEAIRSDEIIKLTHHFFDIIDQKPEYGSILHLLYQCVNTKYFHHENNKPILNKIRTILLCKYSFYKDKKLMKKNIYDHVLLVAKRKN